MSQFAANLKTARQAKGITQEQLARRLDVTLNTAYRWEAGKAEPDLDTIHRLAVELDTTVAELVRD